MSHVVPKTPQKSVNAFQHIIGKCQRQTLVRYFRALLYLFNVHTLLLGALGVWLCMRVTGTTFPLVFTIQQSFTRREKALSLIANLKASAVGLYLMHRDWCQDEQFPASMGNDHNTAALQCKLLLLDLLHEVRAYLVAESQYESYAEQRLSVKHHECANLLLADMSLSGASQLSFAVAIEKAEKADPAASALRRCYRCFSRLSVLNERLGLRAGYTKGGEGGMSRTNQYLRYMISNLEELRYIKEYRTPIMMRAAHGVLLHLFAVVLAPYFVHFCDSWTALGYRRDSCPAGYTASIVYCLITMLLFNTQQDLENPFDMCGMDDVFFDLGHEMDDVMHPMASMAATPSGCSSPRHVTTSQDVCIASTFCPTSPNPRSHPDLCWPQPAPWSQQKMAAAAGANISRRGSTLGTVTEEEYLAGVDSTQDEQSPGLPATVSVSASVDDLTSTGSPLSGELFNNNLTTGPVVAAAKTELASWAHGSTDMTSKSLDEHQAAGSNSGGACLGSERCRPQHLQAPLQSGGLQQRQQQCQQLCMESPRHSGGGATSDDRQAAAVAPCKSRQQSSPFAGCSLSNSSGGHMQTPQQHVLASGVSGSACCSGQQGAQPARQQAGVLGRCSSGGSGSGSGSTGEARGSGHSSAGSWLAGDSSTQLIGVGMCRSDDHVA